MAKMIVTGLDEYIKSLEELGRTTTGVCKKAVYAGAGIMANAVNASVSSIPVVPPNQHGTAENPIKGLTAIQIAGLKSSLGVAPIKREDGKVTTHIGFDGYNGLKTKSYPNGQPNSMIARACESGTSFRRKYPFVQNAVKSAEAAVLAAMDKQAKSDIEQIMKQ